VIRDRCVEVPMDVEWSSVLGHLLLNASRARRKFRMS